VDSHLLWGREPNVEQSAPPIKSGLKLRFAEDGSRGAFSRVGNVAALEIAETLARVLKYRIWLV
jgi:hypothetical protein